MKKADAEIAVRHLFGVWRILPEQASKPSGELDYFAWRRWVRENGYDHYLSFRSSAGPEFDAELWFDEEFGQVWKR